MNKLKLKINHILSIEEMVDFQIKPYEFCNPVGT